jgi:hypothetical protein
MARLAEYLDALKSASEILRDLTNEETPPPPPQFTARGMGLFMAVQVNIKKNATSNEVIPISCNEKLN